MPGKEALAQANRAKKDEFYTQLVDVEAELRHYRELFHGKVVFSRRRPHHRAEVTQVENKVR